MKDGQDVAATTAADTAPPRLPSFEERFVRRLEELIAGGDRAALAGLRRGLGKPFGACAERDAWVLCHLPQGTDDRTVVACCLVASLFGLRLRLATNGSLGASFRQLADNSGGDGPERRFWTLLDSDVDDLPERLRHAMTLLRSKDIPVDFTALLQHVRHWDHPDRWVQKRWSKDFWAGREVSTLSPDPPAEAATDVDADAT